METPTAVMFIFRDSSKSDLSSNFHPSAYAKSLYFAALSELAQPHCSASQ